MGITVLRKKAQQAQRPQSAAALNTIPELEEQLRQCLADMRQNQMLFDLETESELIDQWVFEYQALQCRYRYLQRLARGNGLRAIL